MGTFIQAFLGALLAILWLLVLGRVLVSWVDPSSRSQVSMFLVQATEPILAPVRRLLPSSGMLDLSTLLVLLVIGALLRVVI